MGVAVDVDVEEGEVSASGCVAGAASAGADVCVGGVKFTGPPCANAPCDTNKAVPKASQEVVREVRLAREAFIGKNLLDSGDGSRNIPCGEHGDAPTDGGEQKDQKNERHPFHERDETFQVFLRFQSVMIRSEP